MDTNNNKNINYDKNSSNNISYKEFEVFFIDQYAKLIAYTVSIVNNREAAEDIVQEVFLYAWENRDRINFGEKILSYLFQICYTKSIDYIKSNKSIEYSQAAIDIYDTYNSSISSDNKIIDNLFKKDFLKELDNLLSNLPEDRQLVFKLFFKKGLKAKEISDLLDMPKRTVESHIYLSIKYLRKHLKLSDILAIVIAFNLN